MRCRTIGRVAVALTGASGIAYGLRLLEVLSELRLESVAIYTRKALEVAAQELGLGERAFLARLSELSGEVYSYRDFSSPLASSSGQPDALVVMPCSIKTLSAIVHGYANNIIVRSALAMLRLRRPLVLVPRETPLGTVELGLMLAAASHGAVVLPACPAFYHRPRAVSDVIDFVVGKVLDVLGIEHGLYAGWGAGRRSSGP